MDKNMHKCSIFDVYSSEKKKISDVNKLQEDFESESTLSSSSIEDSNKKRAILGLEKHSKHAYYHILIICRL
ncbi:uncharacterized protein OCT59_029554 [Rhizophagus irregularis]|uniref:uncharacterized protein n=1 Tax=Rhizophagus irregularis TaxID=588596 RepID=UPI0033274F3D|nr:hypothetical protein OCT59_029554 [Rhizophagus irregularis]